MWHKQPLLQRERYHQYLFLLPGRHSLLYWLAFAASAAAFVRTVWAAGLALSLILHLLSCSSCFQQILIDSKLSRSQLDVNLCRQELRWFPLGSGLVVEDKPTGLWCTLSKRNTALVYRVHLWGSHQIIQTYLTATCDTNSHFFREKDTTKIISCSLATPPLSLVLTRDYAFAASAAAFVRTVWVGLALSLILHLLSCSSRFSADSDWRWALISAHHMSLKLKKKSLSCWPRSTCTIEYFAHMSIVQY